MIYLFTGQPGSGKTTLGKKLQFWLQTDKKNWRKSVFHIDEGQTDTPFEVAKYLDSCGVDVVITYIFPKREIREKLKSECKVTEVYCHTKKMRNNEIVTNYEPPIKFFVDLDTSDNVDNTFTKLIKMLI
jgi:adenylylsulfate kinase-like enzyme